MEIVKMHLTGIMRALQDRSQ